MPQTRKESWKSDPELLALHKYFRETASPNLFDYVAYLHTVKAESSAKHHHYLEWTKTVIPTLNKCAYKILRDAGERLQREMVSKCVGIESYWANLALAERMAEEAAASRASTVSDARKILVAAQHHVAETDTKWFSSAAEVPVLQLPPPATPHATSQTEAPEDTLWAAKQQQLAVKKKIGKTWATLMQAALGKIRNLAIVKKKDLDQLDNSGMPQSERIVFDIARNLIVHEDEGRLIKDKVKDLMVAMSGIVDLRTWEVRRSPSMVQASLIVRQQGLVDLLDSLGGPLLLGSRTLILHCQCLIGESAVAELKGEKPLPFKGMIRAIEHLATMVDEERTPCSEQEWVDTWKTVLNCLTDGSVRLI
ncbi:hypothetical protein DFQ26_001246, partial [Actinomortierella ambigua]